MIRFLQTAGQTTKYILGGLLLIICASMVITLIPGGLGSDYFGGAPGRGIVAKVGANEITADDVRTTARQMLQQQMPQGGANMGMLLPYFPAMTRMEKRYHWLILKGKRSFYIFILKTIRQLALFKHATFVIIILY